MNNPLTIKANRMKRTADLRHAEMLWQAFKMNPNSSLGKQWPKWKKDHNISAEEIKKFGHGSK